MDPGAFLGWGACLGKERELGGSRASTAAPGCPPQRPPLSLHRPPGGVGAGRVERDGAAAGGWGGGTLPGAWPGVHTWAGQPAPVLSHCTQTNGRCHPQDLAPPSGTTGAGFPTAAAHCRGPCCHPIGPWEALPSPHLHLEKPVLHAHPSLRPICRKDQHRGPLRSSPTHRGTRQPSPDRLLAYPAL